MFMIKTNCSLVKYIIDYIFYLLSIFYTSNFPYFSFDMCLLFQIRF